MSQFERERIMREPQRRQLTVHSTATVAPGVLRVTLTGEELASFETPGPDDHVKVFFPFDGEGHPPMRDYTPMPPRTGENGQLLLDLDFVLHDGEGIAVPWATSLQPGDAATIAGPRGSRLVPSGIGRLVLIADETALPAVTRWLEQVPADVPVDGFFTVEDEAIASYVPSRDAFNATWLTGDDRGRVLEEHVRQVVLTPDTFVWMAGEATMLVPIRRFLRHEAGLRRDQLHAQGYWRVGVAEHDHHAPIDPTDVD